MAATTPKLPVLTTLLKANSGLRIDVLDPLSLRTNKLTLIKVANTSASRPTLFSHHRRFTDGRFSVKAAPR
jgi:hypothetical protein